MSKKTTLIAILVVVVLIISVIGISAYLLQGTGRQQKEITPVSPEVPKKKSTPVLPEVLKIDTSNWKTYTNLAIGFSVKYPTHWQVFEGLDNGARRVDFHPPTREGEVYITFTVIEGPPWYPSEEDFLKEVRRVAGNNIDPEEEHILLDSRPVTVISYTQYWARSEEYIRDTKIYERSKNLLIYFSVYGYDKNKKEIYLALRNQLLSTFRFLK